VISNNFWFNVMVHKQPMVIVLCWRLAENDVTVTPFVTHVDFLTNVGEKRKSTPPRVIQVKNWRKTISTEQTVDVLCQLGKGERIAEKWCNVRFTHSSICTIHDNADRITVSAKSGTKVFV
jgi:hypothetical protein